MASAEANAKFAVRIGGRRIYFGWLCHIKRLIIEHFWRVILSGVRPRDSADAPSLRFGSTPLRFAQNDSAGGRSRNPTNGRIERDFSRSGSRQKSTIWCDIALIIIFFALDVNDKREKDGDKTVTEGTKNVSIVKK